MAAKADPKKPDKNFVGGIEELNPIDRTLVPPYNIQGGKDPSGVPSGYDDLYGRIPQTATQIQDTVVNTVINGGPISNTTVVNDLLAGQVFGA